MLLTITDPLISGLSLDANALTLAIAKAQAIAEGPMGAARKLERREVTSLLRLANGICYLPEGPVDTTAPMTVSIQPVKQPQHSSYYGRHGVTFGGTFGRDNHMGHYKVSGAAPFIDLAADFFEYDAELNRLTCLANKSVTTPLSPAGRLSARVTYTAGYDFSAAGSDDPDVLAMKGALLDIITASEANVEGITDFTLDDFYRVKINADNTSSVSASALSVFQAYRRSC